MVSIIVTSKNEEKTLRRALEALLGQDIPDGGELLLVSPDKNAQDLVRTLPKGGLSVSLIKDHGEGKPAALNLAFKKVRGAILVLTDGDVYVGENAINELLEPLKDPTIGAVSGRPVPTNDPQNMYGYWAHLLVDLAAHEMRWQKSKEGQPLECSGYLYAVRKELVGELPEDLLAEDAYISQQVWRQGYKIVYTPRAKVYVKFPTNFKDWRRQKVRTLAGYQQSYIQKSVAMRSLGKETLRGVFRLLGEAGSLKEIYWTILLFLARLYVWVRAAYLLKIKNRPANKIWQRIESTK